MKYNFLVAVTFLLASCSFVDANILKDDPKCFVPGECTYDQPLVILSIDDEFKCLDRCQVNINCTWFTYNPEATTCRLFHACVIFDEKVCPDCISGQKECYDPACLKQGSF